MSIVTVLMSTYNGEKYLVEQIESLIGQKNVEVQILVRDDGSTDGTKEILNKYKSRGVLNWYEGENLRSARSFMNLVSNAPESEYYAFCDQDDVWKPDKLFRAVTKIKEKSNDVPVLYCSNYQLVDSKLNELPDNGHVSTTTFAAAVVSSCCTGCTTVFNNTLRKYLIKNTPEMMVMHDDWVHKVCLAVGGIVVYDKYKALYYRQHGGNVDGGVHSIKSKIKKIGYRLLKKDCMYSRQLKQLYNIYSEDMSKENLEILNEVKDYSDKSLFYRIHLAFNKRIRTPYERLNRGFRAAIILKYF